MTGRANRVLVIGRSAEVNARVVDELRARGVAAVGSIDDAPETEFDAATLALVAIGSGVEDASRARMHAAFRRQRRDIAVLDVFGPIAVDQVVAGLRRDPEARPLADEFVVVEHDGWVVQCTLTRGCNLRIEVHSHAGDVHRVVPVAAGVFGSGAHVIPVPAAAARAGATLVLTLDDVEHHTHRWT